MNRQVEVFDFLSPAPWGHVWETNAAPVDQVRLVTCPGCLRHRAVEWVQATASVILAEILWLVETIGRPEQSRAGDVNT